MILILLQIMRGTGFLGILPESAEVMIAGIFFVILAAVARKLIKRSGQAGAKDLEKTIG